MYNVGTGNYVHVYTYLQSWQGNAKSTHAVNGFSGWAVSNDQPLSCRSSLFCGTWLARTSMPHGRLPLCFRNNHSCMFRLQNRWRYVYAEPLKVCMCTQPGKVDEYIQWLGLHRWGVVMAVWFQSLSPIACTLTCICLYVTVWSMQHH